MKKIDVYLLSNEVTAYIMTIYNYLIKDFKKKYQCCGQTGASYVCIYFPYLNANYFEIHCSTVRVLFLFHSLHSL